MDCEYVYNRGNITSLSSNVGGILGGGSAPVVRYAYNTGNVTGKQYVAGIFGRYSSSNIGAPSSYIYNIGKINGNSTVGGIYGAIAHNSAKNNMRDAYNIGMVNGVNPSIKDDTPDVLTVMGDKFVEDTEGINDGYPILAWQVE